LYYFWFVVNLYNFTPIIGASSITNTVVLVLVDNLTVVMLLTVLFSPLCQLGFQSSPSQRCLSSSRQLWTNNCFNLYSFTLKVYFTPSQSI